jgi:hypothetical protein
MTRTQPALAAAIKVGGKCTLAHAIIAANTNTTAGGRCARGRGADSIVLPKKKTLRLRTPRNSIYGPTGLPTVRSAITIIGNGSTIQRTPKAPPFRILAVGQTGASLCHSCFLVVACWAYYLRAKIFGV